MLPKDRVERIGVSLKPSQDAGRYILFYGGISIRIWLNTLALNEHLKPIEVHLTLPRIGLLDSLNQSMSYDDLGDKAFRIARIGRISGGCALQDPPSLQIKPIM
jgi:hypothetical protein